MSNYIYRKIWKQHFGPIPKDEDGRSMEIHHIDGNHSNNDISNFKLVTILEHFQLHFSQGDYGACLKILKRMNLTPEELSKISSNTASKFNLARVKNKTHQFLKRPDGSSIGKDIQLKLIKEGTHHFLNQEWQKQKAAKIVADGKHPWAKRPDGSSSSSDRVKNGTHHLLNGTIQRKSILARVAKGTHPAQKLRECPHCKHIGKSPNIFRFHFENCKFKN